MKKLIKILAVSLMVALISITVAGCSFFGIGKNNGSISDIPDSNNSKNSIEVGTIGNRNRYTYVEDAIEQVSASVVAIKVKVSATKISYGSGVIVNLKRLDDNGNNLDNDNVFYILTCYHVVDAKNDITVYLPDAEGDNFGESDYDTKYQFTGRIGGTFTGSISLIGGDKDSDIAVLKLDISGSGLTSADITKADVAPISGYKMRLGESVFAIGNPSGTLPGTVSVGTISYINRETAVTDIGDMTLLQINTDIYHGSSGGALFNMYGELIGITNAGSDEYIGICYSIPYVVDYTQYEQGQVNDDYGFVNVARHLMGTYKQGVNFGYVSGRIEKFGFTCQASSTNSKQIEITSVTEGSLADSVGLLEGDIIQSAKINNGSAVQINYLSTLTTVIKSLKNGDKLKLTIKRTSYSGSYTVEKELSAKQFIFCDTGVYA